MNHDMNEKTYGDLLKQAAETGFPDKETTRRRILAYTESKSTAGVHETSSLPEGPSPTPSDRTQPHRRKKPSPWKRIAMAGGILAAVLAIVLIANSLLDRRDTPPDSPETHVPPVTESATVPSDETFESTGGTDDTTDPHEADHHIDGILIEQGMIYSTSSDLGPVRFSFIEATTQEAMEIGAHYRLSFDGLVAESYPVQIRVSDVELLDSADSEWVAEAPMNEAVNFLGLNIHTFLVDARESSAQESGIIPIPDSHVAGDYRETIMLPLTQMQASPQQTAAVLSASITPDPGAPQPIVFVYASTRADAVEAARWIKDSGFPLAISLGAIDDYVGDRASSSESLTYTEYTGYLLQDDLFFAESMLGPSKHSLTYIEEEPLDATSANPLTIHSLQDQIALDTLAAATFEPTSESMSFPRYLLDFAQDQQDQQFYIDHQGVASGPLLGQGNYRITGIDATEAYDTIDEIYRSQAGRLSPGLVRPAAASSSAPTIIGGYYRAEISDVMAASDPPYAFFREVTALEDSEADMIRELPIGILREYLPLLDSVTLLDVRTADDYESGFIPSYDAVTRNLPLAVIQDGSNNIKALIEAEAGPDVPLEEHLVLVYGETSVDAGEAVRLLKQAGIPAVLSVGSISNYAGELTRLPDPAATSYSFELDGITFLLAVESPTKLVLEARPIADDLQIQASFNYEYALDIKRGEEYEPAPLVPSADEVRQINEWASIVSDEHGDYRIMQAKDLGFESLPSSRYIESFDLTKHTVLEPGETYMLSKSYRFTVDDTQLEERIYQFEFAYDGVENARP